MHHRNGLWTALMATSVLLLMPAHSVAENTNQDSSLPPGIQNNPGLNGNGQGDTQGNHYGWYKHHGSDEESGSRTSSAGNGEQGNHQSFNREEWLKNHPEAKEAME